MNEVTHEKANELFEKIVKTEAKLKAAELTTDLFGKNKNGYSSGFGIGNEDRELFDPIMDMVIGILRKRLAELKIEYRKL